jgi:hypothetical protein
VAAFLPRGKPRRIRSGSTEESSEHGLAVSFDALGAVTVVDLGGQLMEMDDPPASTCQADQVVPAPAEYACEILA